VWGLRWFELQVGWTGLRKDTCFYVGNQAKRRQTFSVIGMYYLIGPPSEDPVCVGPS
jgi:hypothetical protein